MAEDFKAAFGLGGDERYIGTVDSDGVALAAIQGLNAKLEARVAEQASELALERATRRAELDSLHQELALLKRVLAEMRGATPSLAER